MMKTVMLTSVGSASAESLIRAYHAQGLRVVGCDLYPQSWNASCMMLDAFYQACPASQSEAYLAQLLSFIKAEKVDALVPLTDVEVDLLCSRKEDFAPCLVCTPDEKAVRLCRNKEHMAAFLKDRKLCKTIPGFSPYGVLPKAEEYPILLKPVSGRSSQGLVIAQNEAEYRAALLQRNDYLAQPYLSGEILTVETARDAYGGCVATVRCELLRTVNGLGTTVRILPGHPLEKTCQSIAEAAGITGVVNMEFIHHGEDYYFLEVNPRFSGGVGFLEACGLGYAMAELFCHLGEALPERPPVKERILTRSIQMIVTES